MERAEMSGLCEHAKFVPGADVDPHVKEQCVIDLWMLCGAAAVPQISTCTSASSKKRSRGQGEIKVPPAKMHRKALAYIWEPGYFGRGL
jgi:hypothetical protein